MAAKGKLYTYPENFRAAKALIAAQYSGAQLEVVKDFVMGKTNKSPDFLQKFPLGKVPALESAEGPLYESNAIAYYAANDELKGGNSRYNQAQVLQWLSFGESEVVPAAMTIVLPLLGIREADKQAQERAANELKNLLCILNEYLLSRTFLVGERVTLTDICLVCNLVLLYKQYLDPALREPYVNVNRWFLTCINQPQFKSVLGEVKLCSEPAKLGVSKVQPKKQEKQEKPKQQAKAAEPAGDELEDAPAKPSKDPFDVFPKGNFNMDDFKRFYSNNSEDLSVPYFWEKFDKENYSIWYCEYKYPEDLTLTFMSCNLISGMFQRLDRMRKNAFASMILFGEDHKSSISGIWVWRGHELAFKLSEDWQIDYESYEWKKLDPDAPETKKLVEEYFKWSGDFGGKKFNQGKIFK